MIRYAVPIVAISVAFAARLHAADSAPAKVTFQDHVLPIFRNACLNCHNADKKKGGLDISTFGATIAGSDSNKAIVPGDPDGSLLYKLVTHADEPKMPQRADKLPQKDLDVIRKWIEGGALENSGSKAAGPAKASVSLAISGAVGRPTGPIAMPKDLPIEPVVKTVRPGPLNALATSPWAPLAALGGQKQILLYNTDSLELLGVLPYPEGVPQVIRFTRNGGMVMAGGGEGAKLGRVVLFDVTTGKRVTEVGEEFDAVLAADISPDQSTVALGGPSKILKIFSTADGQMRHSIKKHTDWVTAVAFSPDGVLLASGDRAGNLVVWEAGSGGEFQVLNGHRGGITDVCFRGDSNVLASASEDGTVKLWNMENGSQIKSWNAHGGGALSVEFTHDGRIVSSGRDKLTKTWKPDGNAERQLEALPDIALHAAFDHDGKRVIAGDWNGEVRVWLAADGKPAGKLALNPPTMVERIAAAEQRVVELQALKGKADGELAKAQEAAAKAAAASQSAQVAVAEAQKSVESAKATVAAGSSELQAATAALKAAQDALSKQQAEAERASKGVPTAIAERDKAAAEQKPLVDELALKQKAVEEAGARAAAARAEAQKKPEDAALSEAATKAELEAGKAAAALATVKAPADAKAALVAQRAEVVKKLEGEAAQAAAAVDATKKSIESSEGAIAAASSKMKAGNDAVAKATADLEAKQKAAAAPAAEAKAAADALAKAKQSVEQAGGNVAAAQAEVARLKLARSRGILASAEQEFAEREKQLAGLSEAAKAAQAAAEKASADLEKLKALAAKSAGEASSAKSAAEEAARQLVVSRAKLDQAKAEHEKVAPPPPATAPATAPAKP